MIITCTFLHRMRNVSDKRCRENQNTHFIFNKFLPRKSCLLWDNVEKYCRVGDVTKDNITRRMHFAWWIPKGTNTHSECVILITFPLHPWLHEISPVLRYTYFVCLVVVDFSKRLLYSRGKKDFWACTPFQLCGWDRLILTNSTWVIRMLPFWSLVNFNWYKANITQETLYTSLLLVTVYCHG